MQLKECKKLEKDWDLLSPADRISILAMGNYDNRVFFDLMSNMGISFIESKMIAEDLPISLREQKEYFSVNKFSDCKSLFLIGDGNMFVAAVSLGFILI